MTSGIPFGSILTIGGKTVLNRLQNAGLQDPKVPVQIVYETGNDLAVGKILTEASFSYQLTSWDVSCDIMALLTGETAASMGDQISGADAVGAEYAWEDVGPINLTSPWKSNTGTQGGNIDAGIIVPSLYPTALNYNFGVTANAEQQATLQTGSYFMSQATPLEEFATGDGATKAFKTANDARVYRIGGAGSTSYMWVFGVYVNGVQQIPGVDFTVAGADPEAAGGDTQATITFAVAPPESAIVKYCYFSDTAAAIPQSDNLSTSVTPAAVRGRDITIMIGDPAAGATVLHGVQQYQQNSTIAGSLLREMGQQDPTGFTRTGIDTSGMIMLEPASQAKLFDFLSSVIGVAESEVMGYVNEYQFPMTTVIGNPNNPSQPIKSIYIPDAFFQTPGENVRVQQNTQFSISWESMTGTFSEVKGALPA